MARPGYDQRNYPGALPHRHDKLGQRQRYLYVFAVGHTSSVGGGSGLRGDQTLFDGEGRPRWCDARGVRVSSNGRPGATPKPPPAGQSDLPSGGTYYGAALPDRRRFNVGYYELIYGYRRRDRQIRTLEPGRPL